MLVCMCLFLRAIIQCEGRKKQEPATQSVQDRDVLARAA
jgi:hypothetical protein